MDITRIKQRPGETNKDLAGRIVRISEWARRDKVLRADLKEEIERLDATIAGLQKCRDEIAEQLAALDKSRG